MKILKWTIMRTADYIWLNQVMADLNKKIGRLTIALSKLNAEITRLQEIESKYNALLVEHEELRAKHERWTDRNPDGTFKKG